MPKLIIDALYKFLKSRKKALKVKAKGRQEAEQRDSFSNISRQHSQYPDTDSDDDGEMSTLSVTGSV